MAAPATLVRLFEPWAELYANSTVISVLVVFGHLGALVFGGGLAITLDRATLRLARGPLEGRARHLAELAAAHRLVLAGLALSAATGVLLFAADVETYFGSPVYWTKMMMIVLLLINGYLMTRAESAIRATANPGDQPGWVRLRRAAVISLVLWFAVMLAGVALVQT